MDESGQLCQRARFWASLRLDGELSELEGALLDAHLARCDACHAVAEGFGASTTALRAAPAEQIAPIALELPRSSPRKLFATLAVAAVLVLGVIGGGLVRGQVYPDAASAPRVVAAVASFETPDQLRRLRRVALLNARPLPRDLAFEPI
jgi:predicted anti-sigma-YlaC factor YlaD